MYQLTCSIVLYNTEKEVLQDAINSVLATNLSIKLFLIDNSPTNALKNLAQNKKIEYVFNNRNIGYGSAHNIAFKKAKGLSEYHLILNPDVTFGAGVLEDIYHYMQQNKQVGQLMPKVLYKNGDLQKLCKLLPTPADLLGRRFFRNSRLVKKRNSKYELSGFKYDKIINLPNLSGCFMFFRSSILDKTGGFDERYFIYLEDVDLTRRAHQISETIFYPYVSIYHGYEKESYSNPVLLKHHISSAIKYFNKWGWIIDKERAIFNKAVLKELNIAESKKK